MGRHPGRRLGVSRLHRSSYPLGDDVDDNARLRFHAWMAAAGPELLLGALERRSWLDDVRYRIAGDDLAALKSAVLRRIEAVGGRVELGAVVATVERGELRISMA